MLARKLLCFLVACLAASPAWSVTIDTVPSWDHTTVLGAEFGETPAPASQDTYGQTFIPPAGVAHIVSFAFNISDSPFFDPDPVKFAGYLMEWNGARPSGSVLFESAPTDTSGLAHAEFKEFKFNIGLDVAQNQSYIFFISASKYFDGVTSGAFVGAISNNVYPDGGIVAADSDGSFSDLLSTTPWGIVDIDFAFTAEFTSAPVPEPSSLFLLVLGLLSLFVFRRLPDHWRIVTMRRKEPAQQ